MELAYGAVNYALSQHCRLAFELIYLPAGATGLIAANSNASIRSDVLDPMRPLRARLCREAGDVNDDPV